MAIGLENQDNIDAPDSDYPFGKIRDNPGDGSGTKVNKKVYGDFHQFFAKLLSLAGIVANGLPDNAYSGFQYIEALTTYINALIATAIANGSWTDATLAANTANTGSIYANAGYTIDKMNRVTLRGRITYTGPATAGFITLFTLPTGFRPPFGQNFICEFATPSYSLTSLANSHQFSVQVDINGLVKLISFVKINPGDNIDISLDGISFLTY